MIPIEDFFEDIIAKTMRGKGISEGELASLTGQPSDVLSRLCRGEFCDEPALVKIGEALGLDGDALLVSASKSWYPKAVSLEGLEVFNTPYRDMRVNAYLLWDPETKMAACFDTGTDAKPMVEMVAREGLSLEKIFITHTHNDHISDLGTLTRAFPEAGVYSNRSEPWPSTTLFEEGESFELGNLKIGTLTTSGHSVGGTTYVVEGLKSPVAVVGDALFAGSMGGGIVSFEDAWNNNRDKILTLPEETVICPGHGPMTTVGEEKRHNPFFAKLYR